jgi:hypothetical protein
MPKGIKLFSKTGQVRMRMMKTMPWKMITPVNKQVKKRSGMMMKRMKTSHSMKLEENGRASASKRIRHFHIKYFYITDLIERGQVKIEYCPTDAMLADYMTKPVVGTNKFITLRSQVMNTKRADISVQQECVVHPSVVEPPSVKGGEHHQLLHYA